MNNVKTDSELSRIFQLTDDFDLKCRIAKELRRRQNERLNNP